MFAAPCTFIIIPKWDVKLTLEAIPKCVLFSVVWSPFRCKHRVVYLKVEGHKLIARTIDDPPIGDFPGVGEGELQ
jgi:hypothetical protein